MMATSPHSQYIFLSLGVIVDRWQLYQWKNCNLDPYVDGSFHKKVKMWEFLSCPYYPVMAIPKMHYNYIVQLKVLYLESIEFVLAIPKRQVRSHNFCCHSSWIFYRVPTLSPLNWLQCHQAEFFMNGIRWINLIRCQLEASTQMLWINSAQHTWSSGCETEHPASRDSIRWFNHPQKETMSLNDTANWKTATTQERHITIIGISVQLNVCLSSLGIATSTSNY